MSDAVVGGVTTRDADPRSWATRCCSYLIDNGDPGNDNGTPDKVSANAIFASGDSLPTGFPLNCGPAVSTDAAYTNLLDGDVSIDGGPDEFAWQSK